MIDPKAPFKAENVKKRRKTECVGTHNTLVTLISINRITDKMAPGLKALFSHKLEG
jgi:hypothetical protein